MSGSSTVITELWVAMDKDGRVFMYTLKPVRMENRFVLFDNGDYVQLGDAMASANLTWANSPKQVKGIQI